MERENDFIANEFAIVQFTGGMEIIRTEWGIYNKKGDMISSLFPPGDRDNVTECLLTDNCKIDETWNDKNGIPHKVVELLRYCYNYEEAKTKIEMLRDLTDVETDDSVNREKWKKSRHLRHVKLMDDSEAHSSTLERPKINFTPRIATNKKRKIEEVSDAHDQSTEQLDNLEAELENLLNKEIVSKNQNDQAKQDQQDQQDLQRFQSTQVVVDSNLSLQTNETAHQQLPKVIQVVENLQVTQGNQFQQPIQVVRIDRFQNSGQNAPNDGAQAPLVFVVNESFEDGDERKGRKTKFVDTAEEIAEWNLTPKDVRVFKKLNTIGKMLEYLCKHASTSKVPREVPLEMDDEMKNFPVKTDEDVNLIEEKLKDPTFFAKVLQSLVSIGKFNSVSLTVKNALNRMLMPIMGKTFTFKGRSGKKPAFKDTNMYKVIQKAVRTIYKKKADENEIDHWIKEWLTQCPNALQRAEKKEKKRRESEEAQRLIDEEEEEDEFPGNENGRNFDGDIDDD